MTRAHPANGTLHAYLDGELPPLAALRCAWHVRRCAACRATLEEQRRLDQRATDLMSHLGVGIDVGDGWQRFRALSSGVRPRRSLASRPAIGVAAAALLVAAALIIPRQPGGGSGSPTDVRAQDVCCWDLDGGGPGDDGIFTLSREGEVVDCVILYDDVDANGRLTEADVIRYVSNPRMCGRRSVAGSLQPAVALMLPSVAHSSVESPHTPSTPPLDLKP